MATLARSNGFELLGAERAKGLVKASQPRPADALRREHSVPVADKPLLDRLLGAARLVGVRMAVCTMSMDAMGIRPEELIGGVKLGDVAYYPASAETSGTNLFV